MRALAALLGILFMVGVSGCSEMTGPGNMASVGTQLTQKQRFALKDIHGNVVSLDQVLSQNKAVLLNFWATWCGYCVEEMPDLVGLYQRNKDRGFVIVAVDSGESSAQAADFARKMNMAFPVVLDEDTAVSGKYGVVGIPMSLLVNSQGQVLGEYSAYSRKLEADVEKALAG